MVPGAQCVTTSGVQQMLKLPADSWDYLWLVYYDTISSSIFFSTKVFFYNTAGARALTTGFTNGVGQIWLDDIQCVGNETRLIDCPARPLGVHGCSHFQDAGVSCPHISMNCYYEQISSDH